MKKILSALSLSLIFLSAPAWAEDQKIDIKDHLYKPDNITIPVGTKVTWTNLDQDPHTVKEKDNNKFHSAALDTNDSYSYTFTTPGTYKYFCTLHPTMVGSVTVIDKK